MLDGSATEGSKLCIKVELGQRRCRAAHGPPGYECASDQELCAHDILKPTATVVRCEDTVKTRRCLKKRAKGKCRKVRFALRKCKLTCNACDRVTE